MARGKRQERTFLLSFFGHTFVPSSRIVGTTGSTFSFLSTPIFKGKMPFLTSHFDDSPPRLCSKKQRQFASLRSS